MARAAPLPSSEGAVTWKTSADCPNPTSSAWTSAPRARACSRSSRIRAPAPSPITKPLRRASNGREASVGRSLNLVARAVIWPKAIRATWTKADSAPPATMAVASPWRMAWKARAMAGVGGGHGGGGGEVGPAQAELHGDLAGGRVGHQLGHGEGRHPVRALLAHHRVAGQQRAYPADAGGAHHPSLVLS